MLAAFTYRDFRVQWIGACTSSIGTWMQIVAQNWLVALADQLGRSSSASTRSCSSCRSSCSRSSAACSPTATIAAGRCWRRSTSRWRPSAHARAADVSSHVVQIWHILALSFVTGFAQSFGGPAYQSLIPSLVDKKDLPNAVALNSIQFNVARVLGPLALRPRRSSAFRTVGLQRAAGDERLLRCSTRCRSSSSSTR